MSDIALPGLSRIVRLTDVRDEGGSLHLVGLIDDRSQLRRGESPDVQIRIDRFNGTVRAGF